ncbi:MAG: methyltransferase domain-containing protein [Bacteroidetes bacterium]|nr:methyltransferase domain-containing protein [Bacteroidota bacterium]
MTSSKAKYEPFRFKQFLVHHDLCSMKVGVDGVLLGAWADVGSCKNILDVGTGSGLIALMLAQRNSLAKIHAIDIDDSAFQQAQINFNLSPWKENITLHKGDFFAFECEEKFDLIISNPPYFSNSSLSSDSSRNIARHNITFSLEKLISKAKNLLNPHGKLCFIYPFESLKEVEALSNKMHLSIKKLTLVKPSASKSPKRMMVEITKEFNVQRNENELLIESSTNEFSLEYKTLTKDFYLKF